MITKTLVLRPRHGEMINPDLTPDYLRNMLALSEIPVNSAYTDRHGACVALAEGLEIILQIFPDGKRGTLVAFITRDEFNSDTGISEENDSPPDGFSSPPDGVSNKEIKYAVRCIGLVPRNPQGIPYH